MDRFLIISPHTDKDCSDALKQFLYTGYITHFDWGCADGEHTGYAIIEAKDSKEALMAVPPSHRPAARTIRLNKYSPEQIKKMH